MWIAEFSALGVNHEREFFELPAAYQFLTAGMQAIIMEPVCIRRANSSVEILTKKDIITLFDDDVEPEILVNYLCLQLGDRFTREILSPCVSCDSYKKQIEELREVNINQAADFYKIMAHLMPTLCGMTPEIENVLAEVNGACE